MQISGKRAFHTKGIESSKALDCRWKQEGWWWGGEKKMGAVVINQRKKEEQMPWGVQVMIMTFSE